MTPAPEAFHLLVEHSGAVATIAPHGELDIATLPEFKEAVASVRAAGVERLVVDLRQLAFLDSMSIEVLLTLHGELTAEGSELVVVRGPRAVNRLFEVMELDQVLSLVDEAPLAGHVDP
jgi:anti-sigma B factor antagonist